MLLQNLLLEALGGRTAPWNRVPRFVGANEVDGRNTGPKTLVGRSIPAKLPSKPAGKIGERFRLRVGSCRRRVVSETEPMPIFAAPFVQKALVTAIPTSAGFQEAHKIVEVMITRRGNEDPRVEDIWPPHVWNSGEFMG